jgi:glycosyltransferase involved in cell wall biosynthesis
MRLLFLNYEYPPLGGGSATASRSLIREWTGMGCEVRVLTSHFRGLAWRETADGAVIGRLPAGRRRVDRGRIAEMSLYMAGATVAGLWQARSWRPDAVVAFNGIPSGPVAWIIERLMGVPYVVCLRGGEVPGFRCEGVATFHRLLGPVIGATWRRAAATTANSDGLADLARRFAPDVAVAVIPNGVDTATFHPASPSPPAGPAFPAGSASPVGPASPDNGPVRLLAVGRLVQQKGLDVLLTALAGPGLERVELDIVGDGERRPDLERQAGQLGLMARVRFPGWMDRDHLAGVYRRADVFVLPSRDEGMPNVVLEAMASGLPVIASRIAGACDMVVDGETGLLLPPDDAGALAAAVARLAGDAPTRQSFGRAGRERVERLYSWGSAARAYLDLFAALPGPGRGQVRKRDRDRVSACAAP